jgi:hypothetical protein
MHTTLRVLTGAAAAAVLGLSTWAPAHADPVRAKSAFPIQIWCDNGSSYVAVANGNGAWTPAHDLGSTSILVPVWFGEQTLTVTAPDGTILDQETVPPTAKPGASMHNPNATTSCEFAGSVTAPDGTTFSIMGSVVGFATP